MSKSDELRSRLPRLAAEMAFAIDSSLHEIRRAQQIAEHTEGDVGLAWRKGLQDAMTLLRPARDAHEQFRRWMIEVLEQEIDACGLTADEREMIVNGKSSNLTQEKR